MSFKPYVARDRFFRDQRFDFHIVNETARSWYDGSPDQSMPERQWCVDHIRPGMTVIDCGAHHGMLALIFANATGPTGRVLAYEALPSNAEVIVRNAHLNGLRNIDVRPVGVGSEPSTVVVNFNASNTVVLDAAGAAVPPDGERIRIVRLDDDLPMGLAVDFLKVDVEGHDLPALQGMQQVLAQRPWLDLELHNFIFVDRLATLQQIVGLLQPLGYQWSLLGEIHQQPEPIGPVPGIDQLARFDNPHLLGTPPAR
jgi:FkbM family methyltransferase